MTAADIETQRAAFAAGAEWAVGLLTDPHGAEVMRTRDIPAEAARRYPRHPCPVCGRTDVAVTKAGGMRHHNGNLRLNGWAQVCAGIGQPPVKPEDVTP